MGQKTHPTGFRLGSTIDWRSHWFADRFGEYAEKVLEDRKIRQFVRRAVGEAGVQAIEIERSLNHLKVTVFVSRPGMVIGRGGSKIELIRDGLSKICGTRPEISVEEVKNPSLSAALVAQEIVRQIERRRDVRRVILAEAERVMSRGGLGVKVEVKGRIGGNEIARAERLSRGSVPLSKIRANIDFARMEALTKYGKIGIKVWIYLGEATTV